MSNNLRREIPKYTENQIKKYLNNKDNINLLKELLKLEIFPIKDSKDIKDELNNDDFTTKFNKVDKDEDIILYHVMPLENHMEQLVKNGKDYCLQKEGIGEFLLIN